MKDLGEEPDRDDLPPVTPGETVHLEWDGVFRVAAVVRAIIDEGSPHLDLELPDADLRPEPGSGVRLRRDSASRSWMGTVTPLSGDEVRFEPSGDGSARRDFFRMPVAIRIVLSPPETAPSDGDLRILALIGELGGGGCRLSVPAGGLEPGEVRMGRLGLEADRSPLLVRLRALRVDPDGDRDFVACSFVDLAEPDRQRIVRRLFDEYRRLRRAGRTESA